MFHVLKLFCSSLALLTILVAWRIFVLKDQLHHFLNDLILYKLKGGIYEEDILKLEEKEK